tara:strand:+ start:6838 stop:8082 length:1245 start_codon:yes stop_codon:yes gene_type:complete
MLLKKLVSSNKYAASVYSLLAIDSLLTFVSIPLILTYVATAVYGDWLIIFALVAILAFMDCGIAGILTGKIRSNYNSDDVSQFIYVVILILVGYISVSVIAYSGFVYLLDALFKLVDFRDLLLLALISLFLQLASNLSESILVGAGREYEAKLAVIAGAIVQFGLLAICLHQGVGIYSLPISLICRHMLVLILQFRMLKVVEFKSFDKAFVGSMFREIVPIARINLFGKLASSTSTNIVPLAIGYFWGSTFLVNFNITAKLLLLAQTIIDRLNSIMLPRIIDLRKNQGSLNQYVSHYFRRLALGLTLCICFLPVFNHAFVSIWVGDEFFLGISFSFILALHLYSASFSNSLSYLFIAVQYFGWPAKMVMIENFIKLFCVIVMSYSVIGFLLSTSVVSVFFSRRYLRKWRKILET